MKLLNYMTSDTKIFVAIPVMNESKNISSLICNVFSQTYKNYQIVLCINQPDSWWNDKDKIEICTDNQITITYINSLKDKNIHLIDKSSKGKGWTGKNFGVGWARKITMDYIADLASDYDIIISIDADTQIESNYFESIISSFNTHKKSIAISIPYYHKLTDDNKLNRSILRYEIYMRNYSLNLWRINNPYHFTALGSAISLPVWAYKKIGGLSPVKSGEDFYFLQKLSKTGFVLNWNPVKVYPEARYSDRVFFGTGPALIKGSKGDWKSYPIYHYSLFDKIGELFGLFGKIYYDNLNNKDIEFLKNFSIDKDWWLNLKTNFKTETHFVKACYEKFDALKILQFLKENQNYINKTDEECLIEYFEKFHNNYYTNLNLKKFNFDSTSIEQLDEIRNFLVKKEEEYQKKNIIIQ